MRDRLRSLAALVVLLEAAAFAVPRFAGTLAVRRGDFEAYFWAGKHLQEGHASELYSRAPPDGAGHLLKDFKNVPLVAALFVPFARSDYSAAWRAWWVLSLVSCVGAGAVFCLGVPRPRRAWVAVGVAWAAAHYYPLLDAFGEGQTTQAVTLVLLLGWAALRAGRPGLAGLALAVCAVVKIPLVLLGVVLCLTRRWRATAAFAATLGALALVSIAGWGLDLHRVWFREVVAANDGQVFTALNNQSFVAEATRVSGVVGHYSYELLPLARGIAAVQGALLVAVVVAWAYCRRRVSAPGALLDLDLGLGLALMPFVYPVFWVHYLLFLLVAMLQVSRSLPAGGGARLVLGVLAGAYGLAAWSPAGDRWVARRAALACELWRGHWLWAALLLGSACFAAAWVHDPRGKGAAAKV